MKLDFDIDSIRKNDIELLDCQIDLILRSLEFYLYTYKFIYPRRGEAESEEESLRLSLVRDTYHSILAQYNESKKENPIDDNIEEIIKEILNSNFKKFA
ncbi:MAG: hypothetical protein MR384_13165 [Lachnospiraceae bacterium]|nr:hypothetical protein [Lachnospiraceae bacterium]